MNAIEKIKAEIERRIYDWQALLNTGNALNPQSVKEVIREDEDILLLIDWLEKDPEPKIKGWVARNQPNVSPSLVFSYEKPTRQDNGYGDKFWHTPTTWAEEISISPKLFPDLKWEDEPIEVELIIKRV